MKTTFIYALNDPRDGRMRYIGKANDPRDRLSKHLNSANSQDHRGAWIRSLLSQGLKPELEILMEVPLEGWEEIEKRFIQVFRAVVDLTNSADGGESVMDGRKHSESARLKMSRAHTGKTLSPEHCAKISAANKNPSKETRDKIRAFQKSKKVSAETRAKLSVANTGKKPSSETRAKMRASSKARWGRWKGLNGN